MKKINLEIVLVVLTLGVFSAFAIPKVIENVEIARVEASRLAAKAYYDQYLEKCEIEKLKSGEVIYYNDGHQYWVVNSDGVVLPDNEKNEKTPLTCSN